MKKLHLFSAVTLVIALLCGCSDASKVKIDYGKSELYSHSQMDSAIDKIMSKFEGFEDCTMDSISYAGDERSKEEIDYCNTLAEEKTYDECIVFSSDFHTSWFSKNPVLEPGTDYPGYEWYLARNNSGEWDLLTWGY